VHETIVFHFILDYPRPSSLGMNIDVYFQLLILKLQELWNVGVCTFDVSMKKSFVLRAVLMWITNNFSVYTDLSGWSTKGKKCMSLLYAFNKAYMINTRHEIL
jgi:hypothetical protein